jgi:hypothetical protein
MSAIARAAVVGLAVSAVAALPARAQQQIPIGSSVTGTLTAGDLALNDGTHYKLFTFMGAAGQRIQIDMVSTEVDSYLYLKDQNGTELTHDDDGGGNLNARIVWTLPYTGMYQILANTARPATFGAFTLQLQSLAAVQPTPVTVTPITQPVATAIQINTVGTIGLNQQVQNNLTPGTGLYDGEPLQAYTFQCTAGQTFQMDVLSEWDNYAIIFDAMGNNVAHDDDSGEGLNARIQYSCPQTAMYRLAVTTYSASTTTGLYTLRVTGLGVPTPLGQPQPINQPQPIAQPIGEPTNPIPAPGAVAQIAVGQIMRGRLETGDQTMADGTFADIWQFQGNAGQTVQIDVRSDEFDAYAQLLNATGTKLAEDDNSGGNLNARIIFTLPATGMYQIVVNSAGQSRRSGIYTISVVAR